MGVSAARRLAVRDRTMFENLSASRARDRLLELSVC
jgi:hypothetical protein